MSSALNTRLGVPHAKPMAVSRDSRFSVLRATLSCSCANCPRSTSREEQRIFPHDDRV